MLTDAFITAAVRCAPPDNKPTPAEFEQCSVHLAAEWRALPRVRVVVALGKLAYDACWRHLESVGERLPKPRPAFAHGLQIDLRSGLVLIATYHPSRQNTHTGRLTAAMMADIFRQASRACSAP